MVDPTTLDPPTFERSGRIQIHTPDGTKVAGYHGTIPEREGNGVLSDRNSHKHRLRALDAYAFSLTAIEVMESIDADYVLVRETDSGDVYEWKFEAIRYADEVPDKFLDHPDDPQKYVPRESARAVWRERGSRLVSDPEPPDSDPGFVQASELPDDSDPDPEELTEEEKLELAFQNGESDA